MQRALPGPEVERACLGASCPSGGYCGQSRGQGQGQGQGRQGDKSDWSRQGFAAIVETLALPLSKTEREPGGCPEQETGMI